MRTISWAAVPLLLLAVAASQGARAQQQELAFIASGTVTYSDNAARTTNAPIAATALDLLAGLHFAHNSQVLYADVAGSFLQRLYLQGPLSNETIPSGNLNIVWRPAGEVFTWTITDTLGQISSQPFAALVASDRQNVNVFSTGPDFRLRIDSEDHFDLLARYGADTYGNSELNDRNYRGRGVLAHDFGASGSQISLVYDYRRLDFELNTLGTADIQQAYGQYRLSGARTYVVLEGGEDQLEEGTNPREHTPHILALLQRHLSETVIFEAAYAHRYTNAGEAFVVESRDPFTAGGDQTVQAVALPFEQSYGYAELKRYKGRLQLALDVNAGSENFPSDPTSERHTVGTDVSAHYQLAARMACDLRVGYYKQTFPDLQQDEQWVSGSAGVIRQLSPSLALSLNVMRTKGTGNVLNARFTEDRAWLVLSYEPGAERLQRVYDANAPLRLYDRPVPPAQH
jgi:hypothetical protein